MGNQAFQASPATIEPGAEEQESRGPVAGRPIREEPFAGDGPDEAGGDGGKGA